MKSSLSHFTYRGFPIVVSKGGYDITEGVFVHIQDDFGERIKDVFLEDLSVADGYGYAMTTIDDYHQSIDEMMLPFD